MDEAEKLRDDYGHLDRQIGYLTIRVKHMEKKVDELEERLERVDGRVYSLRDYFKEEYVPKKVFNHLLLSMALMLIIIISIVVGVFLPI